MIKITDENIHIFNNPKIKELFKKENVNIWVWKENQYSYSIITVDKPLQWKGIFPWGKVVAKKRGSKIYKYLVSKPDFLDFEEQMAITEKRINFNKFEASMWIDIETGEHLDINILEQLHTAIVWWTGSWKSVCLFNILYQILKNKYSEVYILDKVDFASLHNTKKCAFRRTFNEMSNKDIISFMNYFFIEYERRQSIFKEYWVVNWSEYEEMRKLDDSMEKLNHIFVFLDEYQSMRKQFGLSWKIETLDMLIKKLMDTVRSTWIYFYYGTQDFKVNEIGAIYSSIATTYSWNLNYHAKMTTDDLFIVNSCIAKTRLFYDHERKKLLKIPYSKKTPLILKEVSNDPANAFAPIKNYDSLPEMLNEKLSCIKSDIFENIDLFMEELQIERKNIELLKSSSEYIPFCILFFAIFRLFRWKKIIGKNTDMFANIEGFESSLDKILFETNIGFYKEQTKLIRSIEDVFGYWQDKEEFVSAFSDVMNNYLGTVLWKTSFLPKWKDANWNKKTEDFEQEKDESNPELINISYTWEIKPVSFNSMYYIDKLQSTVKKSREAILYEKIIKDRITSKMVARQIAQTKNPVILEIEFTLGIPVKKDWVLSKVWRNDLDNLLKATIDWISWTIIADDKQVYWIKTKINYIEKQSSHSKNNKVQIKVFKLNAETLDKYRNIYSQETIHTPEMNFNIAKWSKIDIPSVNSMYFIHEWKKKLTSNTINYKELLKNTINDYKEAGSVNITWKDVLVYLEFSILNPENRDLDNMLKATIDSFQWTLIENDSQVREIMCFKLWLTEKELYKSKIKAQIYIYNPIKDLKIEEDDSSNMILLDDWTFWEVEATPILDNSIIKEEEKKGIIEEKVEIENITELEESIESPMFDDIISEDTLNSNIEESILNEEILPIDNIEEENIIEEIMDIDEELMNASENLEWNNNNKALVKEIIEDKIIYNKVSEVTIEDMMNNTDEDIINNVIEETKDIIKESKDEEIEEFDLFWDDDSLEEDEFEKRTNLADDDFYSLSEEGYKKQILD